MKTILIAGLVLASPIALSGCAGMGSSASQADLLKQIDSNFAKCERHITFQAGVGVITPGAQVSGSVDCKGDASVPASVTLTAPPVPVAAPAQ